MWFKKKIFLIFYFYLRNDLVWNILSIKDKEFIKKINFSFNNQREDYKNIQLFGKIRQSNGEK